MIYCFLCYSKKIAHYIKFLIRVLLIIRLLNLYVTSSNNIKIIHKKKYTDTEKESTLKMFFNKY